MTNISYDVMAPGLKYDGDISCEVGANNGFVKHGYVRYCLNRTDYFTLLNFENPLYNPQHMNLYQAMKLYTKKYYVSAGQNPYNLPYGVNNLGEWPSAGFQTGPAIGSTAWKQHRRTGPVFTAGSYDSHFLINTVITDISTNWASTVSAVSIMPEHPVVFHVYKFFPSTDSTYEYVAPCSNRGLCDTATGLCTCFPGYANDDCSEQNSLHV